MHGRKEMENGLFAAGSSSCNIIRQVGELNTLWRHCDFRCRPISHYHPNIAHQVIWNRFVNVKGGAGKKHSM